VYGSNPLFAVSRNRAVLARRAKGESQGRRTADTVADIHYHLSFQTCEQVKGGFDMELTQIPQIGREHVKAIERMMEHVSCPKDFACYRSGLEALCSAKDIGTDICLECLEPDPLECEFALATGDSYLFGDTYLCACPIRVYVCRHLKR
jgi:hypothetical protein